MPDVKKRLLFIDVCAALMIAGVVLLIYSQVADHRFVIFDDTLYVTNNYYVLQGFTKESVSWAFRNLDIANWQPLTFLSHMLDVELWGVRAGGHALTNVVLHGLASVLLFRVGLHLTGSRIAAAFVALVFAVHPANVESVAWIAQRKSVLCAVLWSASLLAYLHFLTRPSWVRYLCLALLFALALMAKPAVVTLPFVLLLFDFWPLGRFRWVQPLERFSSLPVVSGRAGTRTTKLILEKVPLLALSAAVSGITYFAQQNAGTMASDSVMSLRGRVANAIVGSVEYLRMFALPDRLAVFYPVVDASPPWFGAACILSSITVGAVAAINRIPGVAVGWFWFLGTLVPMAGLVQVGAQRVADRYLYLPMVGLALGVAWVAQACVRRDRRAGIVLVVVAVPWLGWLGVRAHSQVKVWRDGVSLAEHTETSEGIPRIMANNLAIETLAVHEPSQAADILAGMEPADPVAQYNLGVVLARHGRFEEALPYLIARSRLPDADAHVHFYLAQTLAATGRMEEARRELAICRQKIPPATQWRNSIELLRRMVNAPGFTVETLRERVVAESPPTTSAGSSATPSER